MAKNKYAGKALKQVVDADEALTTAQFDVLGGLTTTAAELNVLDAVTAGTVTASKAVVVGSNKNLDTLTIADGGLKLGSGAGTAVTATAAELNVLDAVTAGTVTASKAVVVGSNKNLDTLTIADSGLKLGAGAGTAVTATAAELNVLDAVTAGTVAASKAVVVGSDKNLDTLTIADSGLKLGAGAGTAVTATAAELNVLGAVTAGTVTASKAVVVGSSKEVNEWNITATSASTNGSTSIEPMVFSSTMSGAGGVGGRARFQLDTNVALGGWSNALKAITVYGASGRTTGIGSALCAEMTLSAGTTAGTYAPVEIELNLGTGALTGTQSSLIYASVNGDAAATFNELGFILSLNGLAANAGHVFQAAAVANIDSTHALRINIGGTAYFIPLHTSAAFA